MKKSNLVAAPFDGAGNLRSHTFANIGEDIVVKGCGASAPDRWALEAATYWRPAAPFQATLQLDRLERGRSAATFIWKDVATGAEYPMFGQWLVDCIKKGALIGGKLTGQWGFAKRGANYSVEFLAA